VVLVAALGAVSLFSLVGVALAQPSDTSHGDRIAAGDVLRVDVVGRADISGEYPVTKDGDIVLPVLGTVPANGRTTTELGTDISRRISIVSRDFPQVTVTLLQAYRRKNYVLGAVLLPGSFTFSKPPTVWEAISEAGGPAEDADLSAVQVISEGQEKSTVVDVATVVQMGDLSTLPRLRPGDTVRVPRRAGVSDLGDVVYVFGAVGNQGALPLNQAPDLMKAIIRASPAADVDFKKVEIVRRNGPRVVNLRVNVKDYMGKASLQGNPQLQSGDTVYLTHKNPSNVNALRIVGVMLGVATSIAVLTHNF